MSWELVGVCSYLLVGFYFERQSASNAANKAFITNRVGDAGFILGLLILWTYSAPSISTRFSGRSARRCGMRTAVCRWPAASSAASWTPRASRRDIAA